MDYSDETKAGAGGSTRGAPGVHDERLPAHTCLQGSRYFCKKTGAAPLLHKTSDKTSLSLYRFFCLMGWQRWAVQRTLKLLSHGEKQKAWGVLLYSSFSSMHWDPRDAFALPDFSSSAFAALHVPGDTGRCFIRPQCIRLHEVLEDSSHDPAVLSSSRLHMSGQYSFLLKKE